MAAMVWVNRGNRAGKLRGTNMNLTPEMIGIFLDLGTSGLLFYLYMTERADRKAAELKLQTQAEKATNVFRELFEKASGANP